MNSKATTSYSTPGIATWVTPLQLNHSLSSNLSSLLYTSVSSSIKHNENFTLLLTLFLIISSCHLLSSPKVGPGSGTHLGLCT